MCIANEDMYQRTALRFIYIRIVYSGRFRHVHPACSTNAGCVLSHRPNRLHYADPHLKLCHRRDLADVERVEQYGDYVYHSRCAVVHRPVGCDHRKRRLGHRQPHLVRRIRQLVYERAADMYERAALGDVHIPNLHARNSDLHAALSADADTLVSRRANGDLDPGAHVELRRGSDLTDLECVDGYD